MKEIHELTTKTPGRVKEHAEKWNKMTSESDLKSVAAVTGGQQVMPPTLNNGPSDLSKSGSSNRVSQLKDDDTDSGSVSGPLDPLRKKWMVASALCELDDMQELLKEDPKLAQFKVIRDDYSILMLMLIQLMFSLVLKSFES